MATIIRLSAPSAQQTHITTGFNSLANGGTADAGTAVDNDGTNTHYTHGTFELLVGFGSAPAAGASCDLYIRSKVDGTNYAVISPSTYRGSFVLNNTSSATRYGLQNVELPAGDFLVSLVNSSGQTMSASGNVLSSQLFKFEIATE